MSRVLYFIGHYDYLIYSLLYEASQGSKDIEADFIVLGTKNSRDTNAFLKELTADKTEYGNFALIFDELFLNKTSKEETLETIFREYNKTIKRFGKRIDDYDHIYVSFDEWNSFGIYLEKCKKLPPVSVFLKHEGQLTADIYHYLDFPGSVYFSELQREYRVLNGENKYVTELIVLREGFITGSYHGKPMRCFNYHDCLNQLDETKYERLCRFFGLNKEVCQKDFSLLLVGDSDWFIKAEKRVSYEYIKVYLALLDHLNTDGKAIIFKEHPRYSVQENIKSILDDFTFIAGYVPIELFAYDSAPRFNEIYSIGNVIPQAVAVRSGHYEIFCNDFMFDWNLYYRLDLIVQFCEKNGYKNIYYNNITSNTIITYCKYINPTSRVDFLEYRGSEKIKKGVVVYKDVSSEIMRARIIPEIDREIPVFIINPEYGYSIIQPEQYEDIIRIIASVRFCKYEIRRKSIYSPYEESLWMLCKDEKIRKRFIYSGYNANLLFSGIRIRTVNDSSYLKKILPLPEKAVSKEYIERRAFISPVVILGMTDLAYAFLTEYEKELNIRCIAVDEEEIIDHEIQNKYEIIPFHELVIDKKDYVIICRSFIHNIDSLPYYAITRDQLLRMGYRVCRDFIYYRIFDAIKTNKQILLFCGYCELGGVKQILDLTSAANDYCMIFYHIGRETMEEAPGYDDFIATAQLCDILVHAPLVVNHGVMDADVLQLVSDKTQLIFVPQISFRGYAPYKETRFTNRNYILRLFDIIRYPFLYKIRIVNQMILKGRTNTEILKELKREDLYSEEQIKRNLEDGLKILQIMDAKADIPIYDFVKDNYRNELLFKDCIHANDIIFFEYARRLSTYLGKAYHEEINRVEKICQETGAYFQVASEEPILPCVAKALGLKFVNENRLYMQKITEEKIRMKKFDEWFLDYCNYFRAVMMINRTFNADFKTRNVTIYRNEEQQYSIKGSEESD